MNAKIKSDIERTMQETDKSAASRRRGWGNSHRLGDAHARIFGHKDEPAVGEPAGDPELQVCPVCGYPTTGWCPTHQEVQVIDQRTFEAGLAQERNRERAVAAKVPNRTTKPDNVHLVSTATAIARSQVVEFNRKYGDMGVTFREDGVAVFKDRQAKKKVFQARGFIDRDEVWSGKNV